MKVSKKDFVQVLVDCKGYSVEEAENNAIEYQNDLGDFVRDCGGDEKAVQSAYAYLA